MREFKKLNREKSFDEARTAVQSQIERIFQKAKKKQLQEGGAAEEAGAASEEMAQQQPRRSLPEVPVVSPLPVLHHQGITLQVTMQTFSQTGMKMVDFSVGKVVYLLQFSRRLARKVALKTCGELKLTPNPPLGVKVRRTLHRLNSLRACSTCPLQGTSSPHFPFCMVPHAYHYHYKQGGKEMRCMQLPHRLFFSNSFFQDMTNSNLLWDERD